MIFTAKQWLVVALIGIVAVAALWFSLNPQGPVLPVPPSVTAPATTTPPAMGAAASSSAAVQPSAMPTPPSVAAPSVTPPPTPAH